VARAQIERLRRAGSSHTILVPPDHDADARVIDPADARRTAQTLAAAARRELDRGVHGALVVVGGDTAAEVLGDAPLLVGGTAAVGVPWCSGLEGTGRITLTKPGGFGDADTLVRLLEAILEP
jgi:uncharacterized protein YgbK (DUF1537 family)